MRETPSDPGSRVVFEAVYDLHAVAADGPAVAWLVQSVRFTQFLDEFGSRQSWTRVLPKLDTPDGLWWVQHATALSPDPVDFALPPPMSGTALADSLGYANLEYDLHGVLYTTPPEGPPYADTAAMTHLFRLVGSETPLEEGEEEPVEIVDPSGP